MIDFLLRLAKPHARPVDGDAMDALAGLRAAPTDGRFRFSAGNTEVWLWHTDVVPYRSMGDQVQEVDGTLHVYDGHGLAAGGKPIRAVDELISSAGSSTLGNFLHMVIRPDGSGLLRRSSISSTQLYYAENEDGWLISSRAVIAYAAASGSFAVAVDPAFVRSVVSYGVAGNGRSAFRGTRFLGQSVELTVGGPVVRDAGPAALFDDRLVSLYARDRSAYWDEAFEVFRQAMGLLDFSADAIHYPLSGGKDSRLLLAMILATGRQDRLSGVYTNGPPESPEVRSAADICAVLGLEHVFVDRTRVRTRQDIRYSDKLTNHMIIGEGEMSPLDTMYRRKPDNLIHLTGQEGGLRNIAAGFETPGRDAVTEWFRRHLSGGDRVRILRPEASRANLDDVERFLDDLAPTGLDWREAPYLHRIKTVKQRWVARTWKGYNSLGFAPYVLMTPELVAYAANAGAASRSREEFHFEMLRRADERLLRVPFANQRWPAAMLAQAADVARMPEPYVWPDTVRPASRRASHEAVHHNIEALKVYLRHYAREAVSAVVDLERLGWLDQTTLAAGHYEAFWQLIQCVMFENTADLRSLARGEGPGLPSLPPVDVLAD